MNNFFDYGLLKSKDEEMIYVCVYADTTGLFSEDEVDIDNLCDIAFPKRIVEQYYEESKDVFDAETSRELNIPIEECTFDKWLHEVYIAEDTEELFEFARERGFNAKREYFE